MKEDARVLFGRRLRTIRKSRDLSQEELAFEAGLDRTYISGIESGKRNVSLINICRLAEALQVTPGALMEFGNPAPSTPYNPRA